MLADLWPDGHGDEAPDICAWTTVPSPCDRCQEPLSLALFSFPLCDALSCHSNGSESAIHSAGGRLHPWDAHHGLGAGQPRA